MNSVVTGSLLSLVLVAIVRSDNSSDQLGIQIATIEARLPSEPSIIPDLHALDTLIAIAKTKELRAARLLIKALVWNHDPGRHLETRFGALMLPSAGLLKLSFGEDVLPLLFCACLEKSEPWFSDRIVLVVKYLTTPEVIERWIEMLSLGESKRETTVVLVRNLRDPSFSVEFRRPVIKLGPK